MIMVEILGLLIISSLKIASLKVSKHSEIHVFPSLVT
uniref:ORFL9L n=1 Tax=Tanapox virus TaxID=99000 RepID=Q9QQS6_9POXV|nr:ORFL9L [Tanapox virus]